MSIRSRNVLVAAVLVLLCLAAIAIRLLHPARVVPKGEGDVESSPVSVSDAWPNAFTTQDGRGELRYPSSVTILNLDEQVAPYYYLKIADMGLYSDAASYHVPNYSQDARILVAHEAVDPSACLTPPQDSGVTEFASETTFGNATWKMVSFDGAAMGSRYETTLYRTMRQSTCYEIVMTVHSSSDWTDVDEKAIEASLQESRDLMDEIRKTFTFKFPASR